MPETARPVKHRRRKNQRLCEKLNRLESQLGERVQFLFFLLRKKKKSRLFTPIFQRPDG